MGLVVAPLQFLLVCLYLLMVSPGRELSYIFCVASMCVCVCVCVCVGGGGGGGGSTGGLVVGTPVYNTSAGVLYELGWTRLLIVAIIT